MHTKHHYSFHLFDRLLESGRIAAKNVLVITNLDNRHHIDIVLAFNKYLKVWKSFKIDSFYSLMIFGFLVIQ